MYLDYNSKTKDHVNVSLTQEVQFDKKKKHQKISYTTIRVNFVFIHGSYIHVKKANSFQLKSYNTD